MSEITQHFGLSRDGVVELLRRYDVNPTPQRVEIAEWLLARPQHVSAEQVLHAVNEADSHVSKATVYNTLGLFAKKGLVREVFVDPSRVVYDSNLGEHHHFYNVDSGELADIPDNSLNLAELPEMPDGTMVDGVDVIIRVRNKQ